MTANEQRSSTEQTLLEVLASGGSVEAAAAAAGCSTSTVYRKLRSGSFAAELTSRRAEAWRPEQAKLKLAANQAIDVLREIMLNPEAHDSTRVRAAVALVELALQVRKATDDAPTIAHLQAKLDELNGIGGEP